MASTVYETEICIADWNVQKARTEAVRCGEKIQFDGFYLTRGHYNSGATLHDATISFPEPTCLLVSKI